MSSSYVFEMCNSIGQALVHFQLHALTASIEPATCTSTDNDWVFWESKSIFNIQFVQ